MIKVLIADNDAFLQKAVRRVFEKLGFEVIVHDDGNEAFRVIADKKADIAVMSGELPGMDGIEFCKKVRGLRLRRYVYIILITEGQDREKVIEALNAGADETIAKPFTEEELAARARVGQRIINLENKLIRNQKKLMRLTREDPLTGVLNRRSLFDEIIKELNRASRDGLDVSTILIEAENIRDINERYGHMAGDLALIECAKRISACCREYDKLGRFSGEEFLVLLPKTDKNGALTVAERIQKSIIGEPMVFGDHFIHFSAGIGVYAFTSSEELKGKNINETLLDVIIKKNTRALESAKQGGKNRIAVFEAS